MQTHRRGRVFTPRRSFAAVSASVLILAAGCGGGSSGEQTTVQGQDKGDDKAQVLDDKGWTDLVSAAEKEGQVVVYSSLGGTEKTFKDFETAYPGVKVVVERLGGADLNARLDQEISVGSPGADVAFHATPPWFATNSQAGNLLPLMVRSATMDKWADLGLLERFYAPVMRTPFTIAYNTKIGQPVKSVEDIIKVAGDTPVGIINATASAAPAFQYKTWVDAYGPDILKQLAALKTSRYDSPVPESQSLASGEIGYAVIMTPGLIPSLKAKGAPVEEVVPTDHGIALQYGAAVIKGAAHPNAGQLFVNWLMSDEGQQALVKHHPPAAVPMEAGESTLKWDSMTAFDVWPDAERKDFMDNVWKPVFG